MAECISLELAVIDIRRMRISPASNLPARCIVSTLHFRLNEPPDYESAMNLSKEDIVLGLLGEMKCGFLSFICAAPFHSSTVSIRFASFDNIT